MADGHHRYKTSLHYSKKYGYDYVMVCLINSSNEGMIILPTHRLLFGLDNIDINDFTEKIGNCFDVEELTDVIKMIENVEKTKESAKNYVFGFMII